MVDHKGETWALSGDGHTLYARCPKYFAAILNVVLNGWSISKADENADIQLEVAFESGIYSIDTIVLSKPEKYVEVVDALNEFLVNLAYIVLRKYRNARLFHCAAYENKGEAHLIVAQKNQGKSTLIYQKACSGDQVLADDLLIWLPKTAGFVCLGLPLRLRRPVLGLDGKAADPDSFFAGNGIAYSKSGVFSIAPFGKRVLLDHIWQIKRDYRPDKIPIYKAAQTLNDFLIGPEFSEKRKDKVN